MILDRWFTVHFNSYILNCNNAGASAQGNSRVVCGELHLTFRTIVFSYVVFSLFDICVLKWQITLTVYTFLRSQFSKDNTVMSSESSSLDLTYFYHMLNIDQRSTNSNITCHVRNTKQGNVCFPNKPKKLKLSQQNIVKFNVNIQADRNIESDKLLTVVRALHLSRQRRSCEMGQPLLTQLKTVFQIRKLSYKYCMLKIKPQFRMFNKNLLTVNQVIEITQKYNSCCS